MCVCENALRGISDDSTRCRVDRARGRRLDRPLGCRLYCELDRSLGRWHAFLGLNEAIVISRGVTRFCEKCSGESHGETFPLFKCQQWKDGNRMK